MTRVEHVLASPPTMPSRGLGVPAVLAALLSIAGVLAASVLVLSFFVE